MPRAGWLNENRERAFPFVAYTVGRLSGATTLYRLPDALVVDCGFILGDPTGFEPDLHSVYLARLRREDDTLYFDFGTDAPELAGSFLTFTRDITDPQYTTEHVDSQETHGISQSATDCDEPLWLGYLVTGDLSEIDKVLPGDGVLLRSGDMATVEPGLIQSLSGTYVKSFALANSDHTRSENPDGCQAVVWPAETDQTYLWEACLQGAIILKPGYNATVRQDSVTNAIVFGASVGAGEGEPCTSVPVYPGEIPPDGSDLLEGGPTCNQVIRSFNGVGGQSFRIIAGMGVSVESVPQDNLVIIDANMTGLTACKSLSNSNSCNL